MAFLAGAFLTGEAFFVGAFLAAVFLTGEAFGELLGALFLAGAFFAAPFLAGGAATGSSVALRLTGEGEGAAGSAAAFFPLVVFLAGVLALGVSAFAGAFLPLVDFFGSSLTYGNYNKHKIFDANEDIFFVSIMLSGSYRTCGWGR